MATILYLVPQPISPARSGARLRFAQIAETLSGLGHHVLVVDKDLIAQHVRPFRDSRIQRPVRLCTQSDLGAIVHLVDESAASLVLAAHPAFTDVVTLRRRLGVPVVIDTQNFEGGLEMMRAQARPMLQQALLTASEFLYLRKADGVWAICERDRAAYAKRLRSDRVVTVPASIKVGAHFSHPRDPATLLMVGNFAYGPNLEAARYLLDQIVPRIRRARPEIVVTLVGRAMPDSLAPARADGVCLPGEVDDLAEWYARASIAVVPILSGGGVKFKVLEAMAHGCCVVASPQAVAGLAVATGSQCVVADGPQSFSAAILNLLDDVNSRDRIGAAARDFVRQFHSPSLMRSTIDREMRRVLSPLHGQLRHSARGPSRGGYSD